MRYNKRLIDVNRLTNRERQVLILVAERDEERRDSQRTRHQPAHTVRNFITRIFAKLKTSTGPTLAPTLP